MPTKLYWLNIFGTWPFGPSTFRVRHLLSFTQFFETDTLEALLVEKQVFFLACVDKSKALVRQLFDCAFSHLYSLSIELIVRLKELYCYCVITQVGCHSTAPPNVNHLSDKIQHGY